jgi:chloramphenicol 3-O-phosphotransferase
VTAGFFAAFCNPANPPGTLVFKFGGGSANSTNPSMGLTTLIWIKRYYLLRSNWRLKKMTKHIKNVIIFITGISGVGKRTIGDAICKLDQSFTNVTPDDWMTPILRLLGDDASTLYSLTAEGWNAVNQVRDAIFDTIAHICPREANFVINEELREDNEWHKRFYARIEQMAKEKQATLIPVRLVCDLPVLLERVVSEDRKNYRFKPRDAKEIQERALSTETFKSGSKYELTLDATNLLPEESAAKILEHAYKVLHSYI